MQGPVLQKRCLQPRFQVCLVVHKVTQLRRQDIEVFGTSECTTASCPRCRGRSAQVPHRPRQCHKCKDALAARGSILYIESLQSFSPSALQSCPSPSHVTPGHDHNLQKKHTSTLSTVPGTAWHRTCATGKVVVSANEPQKSG